MEKNILRRFRIIFDIQRRAMVSYKEWRFITWTAVWSWWNGHHFSTFLIKTLAFHKEMSAACYKKQQGRSGNSCLIQHLRSPYTKTCFYWKIEHKNVLLSKVLFPQHFQFCVIPSSKKCIDRLRNFSRVVTSKFMDFMEEDPEVNECEVDVTSS